MDRPVGHGQMTTNRVIKFGLVDYWRMLLKRGPRVPISYFFNAHLFDIINGTDTHIWLPIGYFVTDSDNFEHGSSYMGSWTNEIKRSFLVMVKLVKNFNDFTFIDVGCGKGKVVLLWEQLLIKNRMRQRTIGIDYYQSFVNISKSNHQIIFKNEGDFICADATQLRYSDFGDNLIVYLYNPFDDKILEKVIQKMTNREIFIIYNNPVHAHILSDNGFNLVNEHMGFRPQCQTKIYHRPPNRETTLHPTALNGSPVSLDATSPD